MGTPWSVKGFWNSILSCLEEKANDLFYPSALAYFTSFLTRMISFSISMKVCTGNRFF